MRRDGDDGIVEVEFTAIDDLGEHVSGTATLEPARRERRDRGSPGRAAIVGIGQTEFSKESGRSELQLACEAVSAALDDAGLTPADVDGLVTFTLDNNEEMEVARSVGIQRPLDVLPHRLRRRRGGRGTVMQAAMAVATGVAEVVVCYRAMNERSGLRFGNFGGAMTRTAAVAVDVRAVRVDDAGVVGRAAGPSVHARATA